MNRDWTGVGEWRRRLETLAASHGHAPDDWYRAAKVQRDYRMRQRDEAPQFMSAVREGPL